MSWVVNRTEPNRTRLPACLRGIHLARRKRPSDAQREVTVSMGKITNDRNQPLMESQKFQCFKGKLAVSIPVGVSFSGRPSWKSREFQSVQRIVTVCHNLRVDLIFLSSFLCQLRLMFSLSSEDHIQDLVMTKVTRNESDIYLRYIHVR